MQQLSSRDRIVVVNEESSSYVIGKRLAEFLHDPWRSRMRGHTKVEDFPSSVADHKPGGRRAEWNGGDDQEVHWRGVLLVIAKKRPPALALIVVWLLLREIPRTHRLLAPPGIQKRDLNV